MVSLVLKLAACFLFVPAALFARVEHFSSYSDNPGVFLNAIRAYGKDAEPRCKTDGGRIKAGILPHHLLASGMMVDFFECLAAVEKPKRIILIGPDHQGKGFNGISISSLPWETPFGGLTADIEAVQKIKQFLGTEKEDVEAFSREHSIGNIVPFIRYYFPESRIVPVLVKRNVPASTLIQFKRLLAQLMNDDGTIILLSMDFSHNHTSEEADKRDEFSKNVILGFDYARVKELDIDCHTGLFLLLSVSKERGTSVYIRLHSNAFKISGVIDPRGVTSYQTIFFLSKKPD